MGGGLIVTSEDAPVMEGFFVLAKALAAVVGFALGGMSSRDSSSLLSYASLASVSSMAAMLLSSLPNADKWRGGGLSDDMMLIG